MLLVKRAWKGKNSNFTWRNLADTTLNKCSKIASPVVSHIGNMYFLIDVTGRAHLFCGVPPPNPLPPSDREKTSYKPKLRMSYKIHDSQSVKVIKEKLLRNYHRLESKEMWWLNAVLCIPYGILELKKDINGETSEIQLKSVVLIVLIIQMRIFFSIQKWLFACSK